MIIDSHCHLNFKELSKNIKSIITQCKKESIVFFIVPGVKFEDWNEIIVLSNKHKEIVPILGLHPLYIDNESNHAIDQLQQYSKNGLINGIGEIGLDFFNYKNIEFNSNQKKQELLQDKKNQILLFESQLYIAKIYNLPVILHVRNAHQEALQVIKKVGLKSGGIVHAYSGSQEQAKEYFKLGFKLGIGPSITNPRHKKIREIVKNTNLINLVFETDSPDMKIYNSTDNFSVPLDILKVIDSTYQLRKDIQTESKESLIHISTQNLLKLFNIKNHNFNT